MALVALTSSNIAALVGNGAGGGPISKARMHFAGDASYPTGGYANFAAFCKAYFKDNRSPVWVTGRGGVYTVFYDITNDKLMVFTEANAQVSNATDLSGVTFEMLVEFK